MDDIIELSTLDLDNNISFGSAPKSTNFGGGIELLMNDKIKDNKPTSDIDLDDLNNLENELNDLAGDNSYSSFKPKSDLFGESFSSEKPSVRFSETNTTGQNTAETAGNSKTWDGYGKFNNIPINPDKHIPTQPQMTKEEMLREKFKFLRKLEALEKKGVELSKKYNMESSLQEMMGEYETIMEEKTRMNSIKFQGNMLMAVINGIEFLNNRFDPFDIKLDGWSEQINENITDYDEIFGELYEKYKSKATMAPELKMLFQLGGSAMMVHMTNTMFKSSMPGMDDILRQNPDLMQQFTSAAVNSMQNTNPGFSGFMGNFMPGASNARPPPPPQQTQNQPRSQSDRTAPPSNRPDLMRARGSMGSSDDGINIQEQFASVGQNNAREQSLRPEMKGPSDISELLSGLKTMSVSMPSQSASASASTSSSNNGPPPPISIKKTESKPTAPKTPRKQKSDKNTVSLDI